MIDQQVLHPAAAVKIRRQLEIHPAPFSNFVSRIFFWYNSNCHALHDNQPSAHIKPEFSLSKSIVGIALILVGIGMLGFLAVEAISLLWSSTPPVEAITLLDNSTANSVAATTGLSATVAHTGHAGSNPVDNDGGRGQGQESYCLWPNDTLFDIAQYSGVDFAILEALNKDNPLFAGSTIHLPPGSIPPAQWTHPLPTVNTLDDLPFGVSGIYLGHDNRQKRVALTFDVGYVPENKEMMAMLTQRGIRATFFVVGFSVLRKPEIIADILSNGHELANHSWSHENMQGMNEESVRYELNRTEETVQKAAPGSTTKPYFRAPFGALDETIIRVSKEEGYHLIGWTVDSSDWVKDITADEVYHHVTRHVCPGAIIVMHDMSPIVADALPRILDYLVANGYSFVTLSEILLPKK